MSQRQIRRIEKNESQNQLHRSSKSGRLVRANSTRKPNYQWVSSAKVRGRGGDRDNAGLPPPVTPDSSPKSRNTSFDSIKKSDGQGGRSTVPGATSESDAVQGASLEKSRLLGTSNASTSKALVRHALQYRRRDDPIVSGAASSQYRSETSNSATGGTPLRGDPSYLASLQFGSSRDFANEMPAGYKSFKRETASSASSVSSKQQRKIVPEQTKSENLHLQPEEALEHSKNETHHLRPKAKRYVRLNQNSSTPGKMYNYYMSRKQLQNPSLQTKCDLQLSKCENPLQTSGNLEQSKNENPDLPCKYNFEQSHSEAPYLQPRSKRYIRDHQKLPKSGLVSSVSSNQEVKGYAEHSSTKIPHVESRQNSEESKDEILHVKRYTQVNVCTSSIPARHQKKEDLKQSRKGTPNLQPEAERDPNKGVTCDTVVTSKEDDAIAVPEVPVATSSFQRPHISTVIPGANTWTQEMTSTSYKMPVQLPNGNFSQVSQPHFVPSFQPYPLQPQGMHCGTGYNFSPQVGLQPGSQFGSFNGMTSNYMHNYLTKPASSKSVKITHPETNEELILPKSAKGRLDGSLSDPMAHHFMVLQPQAVVHSLSAAMNCFSYVQPNSFSSLNPNSVPFSSNMQSRASGLGFNSLGTHDAAIATNTGHASLASVPISEKAANFGDGNKSPVSVRSAANNRNQAIKPMGPQRVNYYSKGFLKQPKSVAMSSVAAVPLGASSATLSLSGIPLGKGASPSIKESGEITAATGGMDAAMKGLQNLSRKYDFQSHKSLQEEISDDNSNMESSEISECHNKTLAPPKEILQCDTVCTSAPSLQPSISECSKLEISNLQAHPLSVDSCAQVGFPCTSVEVPSDLESGKDLIHGVSFEYIGQNNCMKESDTVKIEEKKHCASSDIQKDGETEELSEQEVINRFEQDGSQCSADASISVAEKAGDTLTGCKPLLSHLTNCRFGAPTLDSSLQYPKDGVEALENRSEHMKVNESSLSESGFTNQEDDNPISNSLTMKEARLIEKQKSKEILDKADTAGASSDLYTAYKDPDEKFQASDTSDSRGKQANIDSRKLLSSCNEENVGAVENLNAKTEPGNWKGFEISTPELEIPNNFEVNQNAGEAASDDTESSGRKCYSRDFLLTLSKQFTEFPLQIPYETLEGLISPKASIAQFERDPHPSSLQNINGAGSFPVDHHGHWKDDHHKWRKSPTLVAFDTQQHFRLNAAATSFRPGRGGTCRRNLHGQGRYAGGNFSGLLPYPASQRGRMYKGADVDQWQQATVGDNDFVSSSQSALQAMHRAERKYELHKVIDAEEATQRRLKAILNKLTPENFDRLFQQVKEVNIDSAVTLAGLISQIFDKALMEPTFSEMYAGFCCHLASELPDFVEDHEKITFKRLLLSKCQEEFERGEKEQEEDDRKDRNGEVRLSEEEREEKKIHARRRMLGNIRLIGELYKKKMLTERVMHECIEKLLRNDQFPEEEDLEALCQLMCTIGEIIDHPKAKEQLDVYFDVMLNLSNNSELSTRMRFMLKDVIDLRKNKWQQRRKIEGPKKIEELHSDAAQEQKAVGTEPTCAPIIFSSTKRVLIDSGSRPSSFRSPRKSAKAAPRATSSKNPGFASQDVRLVDRKRRHLGAPSVSSPYRSTDDNTRTVGLQGGIMNGMSVGNPRVIYPSPPTVSRTGFGKSRKVPADPSGRSTTQELRTYNNLKQQLMPKHAPGIFTQAPLCNLSNQQGHYVNKGSTSADVSFGESLMTRTMIYPSRSSLSSKVSSGKRWSDERLREMSVAAIREFYSAGNKNNIFQCVGDLNSPSFYPSMISIWVKDSFDRKDRERDRLAGLLVSLTKSRTGVLTTSQLIKGFELVLATLEVAITDAVKVAAFLGQLFGRIVSKNVIPLKEIKRMVQNYSKLPGHPPQKLGCEVMKIAFETIRSQRGESVLKEMCRRANIQLDDFHPSRALK